MRYGILALDRRHNWKARAGYKILVLDRGAVRSAGINRSRIA
jgi:hypothetical protein